VRRERRAVLVLSELAEFANGEIAEMTGVSLDLAI
jgi:DNA-directed RNA polymerase specialized sigma24 family protein